MASEIISTVLQPIRITDGSSTIFYEIDCSGHTEVENSELCLHPEYAHLSKIFVQGLGLGKADFAPEQLVAVYAALEGSDIFVALPPGSGKSAIFQVCSVQADFMLTCTEDKSRCLVCIKG